MPCTARTLLAQHVFFAPPLRCAKSRARPHAPLRYAEPRARTTARQASFGACLLPSPHGWTRRVGDAPARAMAVGMATSMAGVEGPGKWSHFEARGARRLDVTARRRLRFSVVREIPLCDGPLASPSLRCASRLPGVNFSRMPLCVAVVKCEECEASRAWEILAIFSPFSPWAKSVDFPDNIRVNR